VAARPLTGWRAAAATMLCATILGLGFVVPVGQLAVWSLGVIDTWTLGPRFLAALRNSVTLSGLAALVATALAVVLAYGLRLHPTPTVRVSARFAAMGYALPGAVIAVGILLPLARLDHALADAAERLLGVEGRLVITGSAAGLVFAYVVRFLAVAFHTLEASLAGIPRSLDDAARSLGAGAGESLRRVHVPLMRRGLLTALVLVFVETMKEMPATLLLRPFGGDTLAVTVWEWTSESMWAEAAVPALTIVAAGLVPVFVVIRLTAGGAPRT
ncbi:MAG TPA: ABC transporter permease subunit, partial [Candidatus Tectomicrobia bacterium]|nr:ABC transporter permease subunit [Candidatus Tectomicrobia bacterium]